MFGIPIHVLVGFGIVATVAVLAVLAIFGSSEIGKRDSDEIYRISIVSCHRCFRKTYAESASYNGWEMRCPITGEMHWLCSNCKDLD